MIQTAQVSKKNILSVF